MDRRREPGQPLDGPVERLDAPRGDVVHVHTGWRSQLTPILAPLGLPTDRVRADPAQPPPAGFCFSRTSSSDATCEKFTREVRPRP
jgi:hypothetical protein